MTISIVRVSATQIDTFRRCKRKWAWDKLDCIPRKANKYALLGSDVHAVLEKWLRDAIALDPTTKVGAIALAGLQHLPMPKTGEVEVMFTFAFAGESFSYVGVIDWTNERIVLDHKTTGDFKWAKSSEDLKTDVQATIYAAAKFVKDRELTSVEEQWIYYRTKKTPKSRKVVLVVTREECEARMVGINETAREIAVLKRSDKKALDLEPTVQECGAFGGCAYVNHCNLTSAERMKALMAQHSLAEKIEQQEKIPMATLAEKLAAAKAGQAAAPQPVNPPAAVAAATPAAPAQTPAAAPASAELRDSFAGCAMQAIIGRRGHTQMESIAFESYELADEMLKARAKG